MESSDSGSAPQAQTDTASGTERAMVRAQPQSATDNLQDQIERAQQVVEEVNHRVMTFVRERPGLCIAGALAVGYLVGRAAARRWLR